MLFNESLEEKEIEVIEELSEAEMMAIAGGMAKLGSAY